MKKTAPTSTSPASPPKSRRRPKADTPAAPPPRKKMPAEMFVKIWRNDMAEKEAEWAEWVVFDTLQGIRRANLSNVEVEGNIRVEGGTDPLLHLVLSNCYLPGFELINAKTRSVVIKENSIAGDFSIGSNSDIEDFSVENSVTGNLAILNSTTGPILIENSKTGDFFINGTVTGGFSIKNKPSIGSFSVSQNSTVNSFFIQNSKIGNFSIFNSTSADFWILQNSQTGHFSIHNNSTSGSFFINNSEISSFDVREDSSIGRFSIEENSASGDFKIVNSRATIISIKGQSRLAKLRIWHSTLQRIEVRSDSFISHFKCQFNLQGPVHLTLEQGNFGHLNLNNSVFPEFTTLNISDCKVNRLTLNNYCNYGTVFFSGLKPLEEWEDFKKNEDDAPIFEEGILQFEKIKRPSTLRLTDSDLGKIQFINCDLRQFQRFEFSNTKMLEVFVAGSQMPGAKAFCLPNDEKNPSKLAEQKRLAYGQFKKIYEARGDVAGSLRYLSYEMRAYRAMLSNRIKRQQPFSKQWFDYVGELGILWLNQFSTNYGNNWLRGVVVTLFVVVVCFSVYCFLLGYRPQPIGGNWIKFGELASHSLAYLNPFRDEDSGQFFETLENDGLKITWHARLWDYLSRIIIAYFVYQTIQAFRKLGKSSG